MNKEQVVALMAAILQAGARGIQIKIAEDAVYANQAVDLYGAVVKAVAEDKLLDLEIERKLNKG